MCSFLLSYRYHFIYFIRLGTELFTLLHSAREANRSHQIFNPNSVLIEVRGQDKRRPMHPTFISSHRIGGGENRPPCFMTRPQADLRNLKFNWAPSFVNVHAPRVPLLFTLPSLQDLPTHLQIEDPYPANISLFCNQ